MAHGFLPARAREEFRDTYGAIDDDTWRVARFRVLHNTAALVLWAADVGSASVRREARTALAHVLE